MTYVYKAKKKKIVVGRSVEKYFYFGFFFSLQMYRGFNRRQGPGDQLL